MYCCRNTPIHRSWPVYHAYLDFSFESHFSFENILRKNDRELLFIRICIKINIFVLIFEENSTSVSDLHSAKIYTHISLLFIEK